MVALGERSREREGRIRERSGERGRQRSEEFSSLLQNGMLSKIADPQIFFFKYMLITLPVLVT